MINLDLKYSQDGHLDIAGDEEALLELCAALKLCADNGFEVELQVVSDTQPAPHEKMLTNIVISINDHDNLFSVSTHTLTIEGDENFLLNLRSNIPWDAVDHQSGLSCHVHYDRISFSDYLDNESIDVILTKKRRS